MNNRLLEIIFGILCIMLIVGFLLYVILTLYTPNHQTYQVSAKFNNIGGVNSGSVVSMRGVKIGKIINITLDETTYEVVVNMELDKTIKIPKDSTLFVDEAGLFSPSVLAIKPGSSKDFLNDSDQILRTTDWVSLEDKIGNIFLNSK